MHVESTSSNYYNLGPLAADRHADQPAYIHACIPRTVRDDLVVDEKMMMMMDSRPRTTSISRNATSRAQDPLEHIAFLFFLGWSVRESFQHS